MRGGPKWMHCQHVHSCIPEFLWTIVTTAMGFLFSLNPHERECLLRLSYVYLINVYWRCVWEGQITCLIGTQSFRLSWPLLEMYSGNHTQETSTTLEGHLGDKILNLEPKLWYYNWLRLRVRRLWRAWIYFDFRRKVNSLWPELGLLYSLDVTINYLTVLLWVWDECPFLWIWAVSE